ncbi:FixH family protein [Agitococcus lubricus]|uniref:Nitrogen fixation protein FixH n=1 Tax=Agitococcus lubricus TaxID=1077255 RepID=A0A2T5IX21_9GAMM|nr:FixH family protein [Agitococcus lubricus]PTQ88500.1 hypothetical protein C8N29_11121 [Agitococcus lubricus]
MSTTAPETVTTTAKPWYKNAWVWFVIAIPVISLILSFSMLFVALDVKDSEVQDDWYTKGKAINQDFARDDYATALSINGVLTMSPQQIVLQIQSPYNLDEKALPAELSLLLAHPSDKLRDLKVTLNKQSDGQYRANIPQTLTGRYYLSLNSSVWRLKDTVFLPLTSAHVLKPTGLHGE